MVQTKKFRVSPRFQPALDQLQQLRRIADDIARQPIDRPDVLRLQCEGAHGAVVDAGQGGDLRNQRRPVDGDDPRAQGLQHPAPAARAGAEIQAEFARLRPPISQRQRFPKLEIGPVGRRGSIFDELDGAVGKGAGTVGRRPSSRLASNSIQEPSGAFGSGAGNTSGLALTWGSFSWIRLARRCSRWGKSAQLRCIARSAAAACEMDSNSISRTSCQMFAAQAAGRAGPSARISRPWRSRMRSRPAPARAAPQIRPPPGSRSSPAGPSPADQRCCRAAISRSASSANPPPPRARVM